jgi:hypothetical protein
MCFELIVENRAMVEKGYSYGKVKGQQGSDIGGKENISEKRDNIDKNKVMYQKNIESGLVPEVGQECVVVCSGFNNVGSIITMSNSFS